MTTQHTGYETLEPDGYLQPTRFKVAYACAVCGHQWSRICKSIPKNDPPCPRKGCAERVELGEAKRQIARLQQMLESQRAPPLVGANTMVRAIDATANVVMEDYGMTNLKDNVRQGESLAPKLPPTQQKAADNYFGAAGSVPVLGESRQRTMSGKALQRIGQRAMAGAYRHMAVPPNAVTPEAARGQPALRMVRKEPLR